MKKFVIKDKEFDFLNKSYTMGILNITPDSFSDGGEFIEEEFSIKRALKMIEEGADILDIGAESSRPGSERVSEEEELRRLLPVLIALENKISIPISIDTYKAKVAEEAIKLGANIINDISGLKRDKNMAQIVAKYGVYCVLMHMRGTPESMQDSPKYKNVVEEVLEGLKESICIAKAAGISEDKIFLDPGIGFGKSFEHNIELLKNISIFKKLGYPVLIGVSRKRFIGTILNAEPKERLEGSLAVAAYVATKIPVILRVHDVKETAKVIKVINTINNVVN